MLLFGDTLWSLDETKDSIILTSTTYPESAFHYTDHKHTLGNPNMHFKNNTIQNQVDNQLIHLIAAMRVKVIVTRGRIGILGSLRALVITKLTLIVVLFLQRRSSFDRGTYIVL